MPSFKSSIDIVTNLSNKVIMENPQVEETRCRICYEEAKPLITLCQCSGTIAYVHQQCILDWITKKMEISDTVEIPKCEICRCTYSAKLKIGRKKVCYRLLLKKVRDLKFRQIMATLFYIIGTIISIYLASKMVFFLFSFLLTSLKTGIQNLQGVFIDTLTNIIFPYYFVKAAFEHGKDRMKLWEQSMIQIVELTLTPKVTIQK